MLAARDVGRFLPSTLGSLRAQSLPAFELVAVDDGSQDETGALLAAHAAGTSAARPVRVLRSEGVGLAAARNRAVAAAGGDLLAILDGDDVLAPTLLERARAALLDRAELDLVFPLCEHVDEWGGRLGVRSPRVPPGRLTPALALVRPPIHTDSGVVLRRAALAAAGGFDEGLTGCIGLDAWHRVLSLRPGNAHCIPEPLVLYRRRRGQISGSAARMERNLGAFLLGRERAGAPLPPSLRRRVVAAHRLYWASLLDAEGEHRAARRETLRAWREDPAGLLRMPHAYGRAAISLASLLPRPLHDGLRAAALRARSRWR